MFGSIRGLVVIGLLIIGALIGGAILWVIDNA